MKNRMKNRVGVLVLALAAMAVPAMAQSGLPLPSPVEKELAARASNVTEVTLGKNMLGFAAKFMDGKDKDDEAAKHLIEGLDGIYVRSYEFGKPGAYSEADLKPLRDQLRGSEWKTIVSSHEKDDNVDIMMRQENGQTTGLIVIAAEAMEVTIVNIVGKVSLQDLSSLGGQFGVPKVGAKK